MIHPMLIMQLLTISTGTMSDMPSVLHLMTRSIPLPDCREMIKNISLNHYNTLQIITFSFKIVCIFTLNPHMSHLTILIFVARH